MESLPQLISSRLSAVTGVDPELRPATKREFGHFQCNVAMRLAKAEGKNPREVAQRIVDEVMLDDVCEPLEIAGPGFINIRLKPETLAAAATAVRNDDNLGIARAERPEVVVIDYSAPNAAKLLHVGHLRSTIIGDCFNRVLTAQGHTVIPQNHIGDWGRQFGMLIEQALEEGLDLETLDLAAAEGLYMRANAHLKADEVFANRARARVVLLQSGDEDTLWAWNQIVSLSKAGFQRTYARLGVLLEEKDYAGESIYNQYLGEVAADLEQRGIAVQDQGALVVFVDGMDAPAIIRNSHGGYGYDVTDIAAVRYRVDELKANRLIYVVGSEQTYHFNLIFGVTRKAGYLPEDVRATHIAYGMVLGPDGKKFSTREGTAVHLDALLDDAEKVAAHDIAMAAIKYADLSNSLVKDYAFDPERMSATTGNTGPYLQYAHARTASIFRKPEAEAIPTDAVTVLSEPAEQELAFQLVGFGDVVAEVAESLQPHKLCGYLYDLATAYSGFYENCPILSAEGEVRASRLALAKATQLVLAKGLDLLGIAAPDTM